jgi:hypothetical protein
MRLTVQARPSVALHIGTSDNINIVGKTDVVIGGIDKETDPTVPAWAKAPAPPTYTAEDVGAIPENKYLSNTEIDELLKGVEACL